MFFDIPHQPVQLPAGVIARHLVVDIPERPFNRIRLRAVSRQPEQLKARVPGQPFLHSLRPVDLVIVHDHVNPADLRPALFVEPGEQLPEQEVRFPRTDDVVDLACPGIERPGEELLLIPARRHHFELCALAHPLRADLRQQMQIQFVAPEESLIRPQVFQPLPNPRQLAGPLRVIIAGPQFRPLPDPPLRVEFAADRCARVREACAGREGERQGGATESAPDTSRRGAAAAQ